MKQQETTSRAPATQDLSDPVIPATSDRFYSYRTKVTVARPLLFLMDSKANKCRPLADVEHYAQELDLTFLFGNGVWACSPDCPDVHRLLGARSPNVPLQRTYISTTDMHGADFDAMCQAKDVSQLIDACSRATAHGLMFVRLVPDMIVSVTTESGKYALLRINELTHASVQIDACHLLVQRH